MEDKNIKTIKKCIIGLLCDKLLIFTEMDIVCKNV